MRLLDLFCCAGGAAMGYHRAGFTEIVGVDIRPQPRYPFQFVQADALEYVAAHGHEFDAIHASPPCQGYSEATPVNVRERLPKLIGAVREILAEIGKPYIIENVENARADLVNPVMLCGTMFGMKIWRHRYFETGGFFLLSPKLCAHINRPFVLHPGSNARRGAKSATANGAREAMGISWMVGAELNEAIPPAYTEFLGRHLLAAIQNKKL